MTIYATTLDSLNKNDCWLINKVMKAYIRKLQTRSSLKSDHAASQLKLFNTLIKSSLNKQKGIHTVEKMTENDEVTLSSIDVNLSMTILSACNEYTRQISGQEGYNDISQNELSTLRLIQSKILSGTVQISGNNFWR